MKMISTLKFRRVVSILALVSILHFSPSVEALGLSPNVKILNPVFQVADQNVAVGQRKVHIGRFDARAIVNDFEIEKIEFELMEPDAKDSIESIVIKYPTDLSNPLVLDGMELQYWSGTSVTFDLTTGLAAAKGVTETFDVYVNIADASSADVDDKIQLQITPAGATKAIDLSTSLTYSAGSIVPVIARTAALTVQ